MRADPAQCVRDLAFHGQHVHRLTGVDVQRAQRPAPFGLPGVRREDQLDEPAVLPPRRGVQQQPGGDREPLQHQLVERQRLAPLQPHAPGPGELPDHPARGTARLQSTAGGTGRGAGAQGQAGGRVGQAGGALGEPRGLADEGPRAGLRRDQPVEETDHPDGVLRIGVQRRKPQEQALHCGSVRHPPPGGLDAGFPRRMAAGQAGPDAGHWGRTPRERSRW
ncbi:Uncharacterised protein [Mycobacterium tuberculosis]|nr:Uncharacterised protein [Mycobacterium tuberculosis]